MIDQIADYAETATEYVDGSIGVEFSDNEYDVVEIVVHRHNNRASHFEVSTYYDSGEALSDTLDRMYVQKIIDSAHKMLADNEAA